MLLLARQCRVLFFFFSVSRLAPTCVELGRFALTRHKSIRIKQNHRNTPIQAVPADSGRNSKKKKKKKRVQNASFELNNKTLNYLSSQNAPFFTSIFSSLSLSVLYLPSWLSALHLPSLINALSHGHTQAHLKSQAYLTSPYQPTLNSSIKLIKAFNLSFSISSSLHSHMLWLLFIVNLWSNFF